MTATHDANAEAAAQREHDTSWSANLEKPEYGSDREALERDALDAIERTASGTHVNLVTHPDHGHPSEYLYDTLERECEDVEWEFVDRCGCGGYVTRVHVD